MSELLATSKAGDFNTATTASLLSIFGPNLRIVSPQSCGVVLNKPGPWRVFNDGLMRHFTSNPSETPTDWRSHFHFRATPSWSQQGGGR